MSKKAAATSPSGRPRKVVDALADSDTEFRCKDCGGEVKILGKTSKTGAAAYVEHKRPADAEFCPSGLAFKRATDRPRKPRLGPFPVN